MKPRIKVTKAEIFGGICFVVILIYIIFQLPKMSQEQQIDTGLVMIIAIILFTFVYGQLAVHFENRKQKKLSQWMHEEKKGLGF
jgi:membrane protein DedA with SNARE-associated domain